MAITILGNTICKICGKVIENDAKIISLPAFVFNDWDSLVYFNDSAFHETCFVNHKLSKEVVERVKKLTQEMLPINRICAVCKKQIIDPNDYLFLGYLTDNLSKFNYMKLHLSCLPKWNDIDNFKNLLVEAITNKTVKGIFYENVLKQLSSKIV